MNINDTLVFQNLGLPDDIRRRKEHGDFDGAIRLIDRRLADPNTTKAMGHCLRIHRKMLLRLPGEFPYTRQEAMAIIREKIPEFTDAEFDEYVDARRIRWIYLNGEERYFNRFFSSLCKAAPGFAQRAGVKLPGVESATSGSQEDAIIINDTRYAIACDECGTLQNCSNLCYIDISDSERLILEEMFTSRGGKFP